MDNVANITVGQLLGSPPKNTRRSPIVDDEPLERIVNKLRDAKLIAPEEPVVEEGEVIV